MNIQCSRKFAPVESQNLKTVKNAYTEMYEHSHVFILLKENIRFIRYTLSRNILW
jgi:hypothetical protein